MAEIPIPRQIPRGADGVDYFRAARKLIKLKTTQDFLATIAERVKERAGEGHAVKRDQTRDRVRVQVLTVSNTAKRAEASDKTLTKAFAAERTTPRR